MNKLELILTIKSLVDNTTDVKSIVDNFDHWPISRQRNYINKSFFKIVEYSYNNIPYYHNILVDYGYRPQQFTDIDSINKFPILTKELVRKNYNLLRPNNISNLKYKARRSGGTTGEPIESLISKNAMAFETFIYFKGLKWMGWNPQMTFVKLFGGSLNLPKKQSFRQKIYNLSINAVNIPAFEINRQSIYSIYNQLKDLKSICLIGYASVINNMATLMKKQNLKLNNVDLVITTSEKLIEDWKHNIANLFECEIRSYYGSGEIASLGYQLYEKNEFYKVPSEHILLEDINKNILVTQLHNTAQPLIRYRLGDDGEIIELNGRKFISNLIGREADYFTNSKGDNISPIFGTYSIQKSGIPVSRYQYVQYPDYSIEFRYELSEEEDLNTAHKNTIEGIVNYIMGEPTKLYFKKTKDFVVSSSNKHNICVNFKNN